MGKAAKYPRWVERLEGQATHRLPPRDPEGLAQFVAYENGGPAPSQPYGLALLDCKRWQEWTLNYVAGTYLTPDWPGWAGLAADCPDDPKWLRMIRDRVYQLVPGLKELHRRLGVSVPGVG